MASASFCPGSPRDLRDQSFYILCTTSITPPSSAAHTHQASSTSFRSMKLRFNAQRWIRFYFISSNTSFMFKRINIYTSFFLLSTFLLPATKQTHCFSIYTWVDLFMRFHLPVKCNMKGSGCNGYIYLLVLLLVKKYIQMIDWSES